MKLSVIDTQGRPAGELELGFQVVENGKGTQAVHDSVVAYMAAQRMGTACTKTMGEVAGTGKKPWRQKGTGRARAGSFASPLWRGGGVVFGPKPRDFTKKVGRTTRQLALRKALSARIQAGEVTVLDGLRLDSPKTKGLASILSGLNVDGTALLVVGTADRNLVLAARNIVGLELTTSTDLNTYQVLKYDRIVATRDAFDKITQRLNA